MSVFVLDKRKRPLMPCSEKRARKLLESGRARVHKAYPFAIRLIDRLKEESVLQPMRLSLDPGSKTTGLALCRMQTVVEQETGEITAPVMHISFLMELVHRGAAIKKSLGSRAVMRGRRRSCNLRYRAPRFLNRGNKGNGWIAPSLTHRVLTTGTWVKRLRALAPVTHLAQELVKFDMQQMQNPEIDGIEYQQGTLQGYSVREYLLEKFNRTCVYCDAKDTPLNLDHIHPKANGGSNRVSNLALACIPCNQKKGSVDVRDFVKDPARLKRIIAQAKAPLKDAAAVNVTRWVLFNALKASGLPVETGSGAQTKFNRARLGIIKTHALDAACVGQVGDVLRPAQSTLQVKCTGRGSHCRTRVDAYGFPRGYLMREKSIKGFRTGDMVVATVTTGKKVGSHTGRVAIRKTGRFNIQTREGVIQGIGYKHCKVIARGDGYSYSYSTNLAETKKGSREAATLAREPALPPHA